MGLKHVGIINIVITLHGNKMKKKTFFLFAQKMFHDIKNTHETKCSLNYAATLRMNILFQHGTTEINPKVIQVLNLLGSMNSLTEIKLPNLTELTFFFR